MKSVVAALVVFVVSVVVLFVVAMLTSGGKATDIDVLRMKGNYVYIRRRAVFFGRADYAVRDSVIARGVTKLRAQTLLPITSCPNGHVPSERGGRAF